MKIQTLTTKMVQKNLRKKEIKALFMIVMISFVLVISLSYVSAAKLLCLTYGQSIPNAQNPRYTCWSERCVNICVNDNLFQTNPAFCNGIKGCQTLNSNGSIDSNPPEINVFSPVDNAIYNSSKVPFNIQSNEPATLSYLDMRGRWKRLVSLSRLFTKSLTFSDGLNNITIKGEDRNGNEMLVTRSFYVDSEEPNVRSINPRDGFANGMFDVQFSEENPKVLKLHYGNVMSGMREKIVDINTCTIERGRYTCQTSVDLKDYDNEEITAYFHLVDIAGSSDESKHVMLDVDSTAPVLNNPSSFWMQDEKYIVFNISITEINFDEISYIDSSESRPREKRICSRLKDGICEKKSMFKKGHHNVQIVIKDDAGNMMTKDFEFDVV
ncbi:hypothetical protein J4456_00845 [Candidatus Pacearchaeota archaeon]|nr:hypothetical protein [Candidatus Pacearchaeota archaeon]